MGGTSTNASPWLSSPVGLLPKDGIMPWPNEYPERPVEVDDEERNKFWDLVRDSLDEDDYSNPDSPFSADASRELEQNKELEINDGPQEQ